MARFILRKKMNTSKNKKKNKGNTRLKIRSKLFHKRKPLYLNYFIMLVCLIVVFFTLNNANFFGIYNYKANSVIKEDLYLQTDIVDIAETQKLKQLKAAEIEPVMYIDFSKQVESKKNLTDFFTRLLEIKTEYANDTEVMKKIFSGIERKNIYALTEEELSNLIVLSTSKINLLNNYAVDIAIENMTVGLTDEDKSVAIGNINTYIASLTDLTKFDKTVLTKFITGAMVTNKFVDTQKTNEKIDNAISKIDDITYKKGTLFLKEGEVLTKENYDLLKSGGVIVETPMDNIVMMIGLFGFLLVIWAIMYLYLVIFEKDVLMSNKSYAILMTLFMTFFLTSSFFNELSPYFLPVPTFSILAGIMLSPSLALFFSIVLLILTAMWTNLGTYMMIAYLLTILVTRATVRNIKQRSQVVTIGAYVSIILSVFTIMQAMINKQELESLPYALSFSIANGVLCAVLSIGIMPLFEGLFGILTPFKILELTNPNRPLLKRLLIEAPGTYHHSIMVGNLAETAAHDIGANSLLTRVAAFYHDVGKLERPYYYKENQVGHDNPHDKLPPQVSANFIRSHMTYGVDLLEKNKLPQEIIEIIKAHHGTSLIKYFYHREQINNPDVDISKFLYPGPKPTSKEAVILMLADSIEAAVRSEEDPTQNSITLLIDKIIQQKMAENQFTNAEITFKELEAIKRSFLNVLSGIFHERIAYPEINLDQISKEAFDGISGKKEN